jgi:lipoprotein-anchoring transpeptidase ErfK/SrfK
MSGFSMSGFTFSGLTSPLVASGVSALVIAFCLAPTVASADPARSGGNMGGGFVEFLMTGSAPTYRQGAPVYAAPRQPIYVRPAPVARGQIIQQHAIASTLLEDDPYSQPGMAGRGLRRERAPAPIEPGFESRFEKQEVSYGGAHGAGTLVIDTPNKYLYLVQGNGRALRYGIGVGRPGFEWAGVKTVSMKREWPDWRPPSEMLKRRPDLPRHMAGGPDNPLGARALYLGSSLYRIHGTNEPQTIGRAVSSGCIRMRNQDVEDLYSRVKVGTKVIVI